MTSADPDRVWTVREIAEFGGIGGLGPVVVGSPERVADELQSWVADTDIDGFNLAYAVSAETFSDIVDLLVPELQRRSVYKQDTRPARFGKNCLAVALTCRHRIRPRGIVIGCTALPTTRSGQPNMNPPDAMTTTGPSFIHVPVAEIFAAAALGPDAPALLHKQRGQWRSWSWTTIAAESERLARALRERGVDDRSTVAISGDYTPVLVLFAIAAANAGARVASIPTALASAALTDWLRNEPATLAFVGLRAQLGTWRSALRTPGGRPRSWSISTCPGAIPPGQG